MPPLQDSAQTPVTRSEIFTRGLSLRCPNCGARTLYEPGRYFRMKPACSVCGMRWDKDEAAFLGSTVINYGLTAFGLILPWIVVTSVSDMPAAGIATGALVIAVLVPVLLYRPSKSWWLMCYYLALPGHLPRNWSKDPATLPPDE